jgi:negative regulator of replication initiation
MAQIGFTLAGRFHPARNAIEVFRQLFEELTRIDPSFPERFAGLPKHGRTRRYLARDQNELYPGHPDLCREASIKLSSGWWLGTNCSRQSITRIIEMARPVMNDKNSRDFQFNLGEQA